MYVTAVVADTLLAKILTAAYTVMRATMWLIPRCCTVGAVTAQQLPGVSCAAVGGTQSDDKLAIT